MGGKREVSFLPLKSYINYEVTYSPIDCMIPFSAPFMGSLSGSYAEGWP